MMIDRKLEPLVKRQMMKYLGELEDDDLIMFVLEHLKDHKGPQKLVDGLEPVSFLLHLPCFFNSKPHSRSRNLQVLEDEALDFVIGLWRQVIFESLAYAEGLNTEWMMAD